VVKAHEGSRQEGYEAGRADGYEAGYKKGYGEGLEMGLEPKAQERGKPQPEPPTGTVNN
jgi:flagellar biosynthesis/type III secretory pathway protein FliH